MRSCRFFLALSLLWVAACGDDAPPPADAAPDGDASGDADAAPDAAPPMDWPTMDVPRSTTPEAGVRRDVFLVPGVHPPDNPTTSAATPAEYDFTQVVRYREDATDPVPARAVIVAMPGFLGGGPSFETLARELVKRGAASGEALEVWAIDRRSNLLEDLRGMNTAEAAGNPEIAQGYYFGRETLDSEAFAGFRSAGELSFESEWGLATHVEDLRRVIALVPEADRPGHVFLMGHSLGGAFAEAYASWRFEDGTRGVEELAGLILVDGRLSDTASSEDEYRDGTMSAFGPMPGVAGIRQNAPFTALPILGVGIYARAEIMSMRTLVDPTGIVNDGGRNQVLSILLSLTPTQIPEMTNRAALGWGFDTASNAFSFAAASCGQATGGTVEAYDNPFGEGTLLHPTDPDATYDWIDALDADPREHTPIAALAESWAHGATNFAEWYFPSRLPVDLAAVGGSDVPEDDYRAAEGLRAFDRELVDAPVLAIAAALVGPTGYDTLTSRLASEVGAGRRNAGATRADELGLRIVDLSHLSHLDPLTGVDTDDNPTAREVERFVGEHVADGTIVVPAM